MCSCVWYKMCFKIKKWLHGWIQPGVLANVTAILTGFTILKKCRYFATHQIQNANRGALHMPRKLLSSNGDKDDCLWPRYWLQFSLLKPNWLVRWRCTFTIGWNVRPHPRGGTFSNFARFWLVLRQTGNPLAPIDRSEPSAPSGMEMLHKHRCFRNNAWRRCFHSLTARFPSNDFRLVRSLCRLHLCLRYKIVIFPFNTMCLTGLCVDSSVAQLAAVYVDDVHKTTPVSGNLYF